MIIQLIAGLVGTLSFSVLFSVPRKDYLPAGFVGTVGWIICYALTQAGFMEIAALFLSTLVVVFLARYFAVMFQAPSTLFLIPGIFPLVPGGKIFWAAYHFMLGNSEEALLHGAEAFKCAFVIVLAIMAVLHLPGSFFKWAAFHRRKRKEPGK